jgi:hypothetical protein
MALGWLLSDHGENLLSFLKRNHNNIRFYLTRVKLEISKVIIQELEY